MNSEVSAFAIERRSSGELSSIYDNAHTSCILHVACLENGRFLGCEDSEHEILQEDEVLQVCCRSLRALQGLGVLSVSAAWVSGRYLWHRSLLRATPIFHSQLCLGHDGSGALAKVSQPSQQACAHGGRHLQV